MPRSARSNISDQRHVPRVNLAAFTAVALSIALLLTVRLSTDQTGASAWLNKDRRSAHLTALGNHDAAARKAQAWANHLASLPYTAGEPTLSHSRLTDGFKGVCYRSIGENVGTVEAPLGLSGMERAFMASKIHRTNIMNKKWNRVGTGVARTSDKKWIIEVQVFVTAC